MMMFLCCSVGVWGGVGETRKFGMEYRLGFKILLRPYFR